MSKESSPLINKIPEPQLPHWSEYVQPTLMAIGSGANLVSGFIGIHLGGHLIKQDDPAQPPSVNPFYFVAAVTSGFYCCASLFAIGKIAQRRASTWVEIEEHRRTESELKSIKVYG